MKPAAAVKPAAVNPGAAVQALTPSERKTSETLWVQERKLESDITRVATAADGRQRVAAAIAKHYSVPEKLVSDLRARKIAHGEITVALALSQQLVKKEKTTQPKAVDRILAMRNSGQGWGAIARSLGLKLGDALDHVEAVDKQVAKLDTGKKSTKG
jgi:hypothetical protein